MSDTKVFTEVSKLPKQQCLQTTLGELICAIVDAAEEARVEQHNLAAVTEMVLHEMLHRPGKPS